MLLPFSQTNVVNEGDSSNKKHDLSSTTTYRKRTRRANLKPQQLLGNEAVENQQQKEDIELDSSNDETEKGRSQGGLAHSSDDLYLAAEMMMPHPSSQEFKLTTSDVQFNSSSFPTNNSSS